MSAGPRPSPFRRLAPSDRRALLLGVLTLAPVAFVVFVVRPGVAALLQLNDHLRTEHAMLIRERSLLTEAPRLPARRVASVDRLTGMAERLFPGDDSVAAAGALAAYVTERAAESRVLLVEAETRPVERVGTGVVAIPMTIRAQSDLQGMLGFLQVLESGPKLLRVTALSLEGGQRAAAGSESAPSQSMEVLSATMVIRGFALAARLDAADHDAAAREAEATRNPVTVPSMPLTDAMQTMVATDPFSVDRKPPAVAYRLPGEIADSAAMANASREAKISDVQLIGTVVSTGGSGFAMCRLGTAAPKVVRTGERLGGLLLQKVEPGRVVFVGANGSPFELRAGKVGS